MRDFWLMIWQERPSAIVMVTKAVENGRVGVMFYHLSNSNCSQCYVPRLEAKLQMLERSFIYMQILGLATNVLGCKQLAISVKTTTC